MSEGRKIIVLRKRHTLPNRHEFWTVDQDYTTDVDKAQRFNNPSEAAKWLEAHRHLRQWLTPAEVTITGGKQT
jgi:hypothetical protein